MDDGLLDVGRFGPCGGNLYGSPPIGEDPQTVARFEQSIQDRLCLSEVRNLPRRDPLGVIEKQETLPRFQLSGEVGRR